MAEQDIPLADLEAAREQLVRIINTSLTPQEREFLLSFKNYTPNWTQLGLAGIDQLPAVRWKLQNLARMKPENMRRLTPGSKTCWECENPRLSKGPGI